MGQRGPQPKPSAVLKLNGSWRTEDRKKTELSVPCEAPSAPDWFCAEAKQEWGRIIPQLVRVGIVTPQDRAMLVVHCQAWGEYEQAARRVNEFDAGTAHHEGHIVDHPRVVMGRAFERLMKTADRFGMSASARTRLNGKGNAKDEKPKPKGRFFPDGPATKAV
jgi:P27 family predicted phage terminase small subunit